MARTTYWKRETFMENTWGTTPAPFWNRNVFTLLPGETLLRVRGHLSFWVNDIQSAVESATDLHVPYTWALVWDFNNGGAWDGNTLYGTDLQEMKEQLLFVERFWFRDDYTPSGYAGVNQGFIDGRRSNEFDTRAQRTVPVLDPPVNAQLKFIAAGISDIGGAPINFRPKLEINALVLGVDTPLP